MKTRSQAVEEWLSCVDADTCTDSGAKARSARNAMEELPFLDHTFTEFEGLKDDESVSASQISLSQSGRLSRSCSLQNQARRRMEAAEKRERDLKALHDIELRHAKELMAAENERLEAQADWDAMTSASSLSDTRYELVHTHHKAGTKSSTHDSRMPSPPRAAAQSSAVLIPRVPPSDRWPAAKPAPAAQSNADKQLAAAAQLIHLPKPELLTFSGRVTEYRRFMSAFDASIHCAEIDDRLKLQYLIQFCKGDAKRCIEECVVIVCPSKGYLKARDLLNKRYGRPWQIAEEYVDQLTKGPAIKNGDSKALSDLVIDLNKCALNLESYQNEIDNTDTIKRIVRRLPFHLRTKWAEAAHKRQRSGRAANFEFLVEFLEEKESLALSLYGRELCTAKQVEDQPAGKVDRKIIKLLPRNEVSTSEPVKRATTLTTQFECGHCHGTCETLEECSSFIGANLLDRQATVKREGRCFNCLHRGHRVKECNVKTRCESCNRKHHSLLHDWNLTKTKEVNEAQPTEPSAQVGAVAGCHSFLGFIPITLHGNGKSIRTCALLDNGSTRTFMDNELAVQLGLEGNEFTYQLTTINEECVKQEGKEVSLTVSSDHCPEGVTIPRVWTTSKLQLPCHSQHDRTWVTSLPYMRDLDIPTIQEPYARVLIGVDSGLLTPLSVRASKDRSQPYAEETILGWVLRGPSMVEASNTASAHFVNDSSTDLLQERLTRLWMTDFEGTLPESTCPSIQDKEAKAMMKNTITHNGVRYELPLPWKSKDVNLPWNKASAQGRLKSLKSKLVRNPELHQMYTTQMEDYINSGYAEEAIEIPTKPPGWYLPHHPVANDRKPGKVRVVFDGAATHQGTSINDHLLQGPDLNNNLSGVIMRFRQHQIGLVADIKGMFHQVNVADKDREYLRFLWWKNGELDRVPSEYKMTRHVFGLKSSPSCVTFALQKTAEDYGSRYDENTSRCVFRDFYVDDFLKSVPSVEAAVKLMAQLRALLAQGGFSLEKWLSNNVDVMLQAEDHIRSPAAEGVLLGGSDHRNSTLGVLWNPVDDSFGYKAKVKDHSLTKRGLLSAASSLFDPLGWIAPVILLARLILQEASRIGLSWDEPLPASLADEWTDWCETLPHIEEIVIPRAYGLCSYTSLELHVFSDASTTGYGACAYLKMTSEKTVHSKLIMGRSRLAPIKQVTVPKLELTAAMVASRLRTHITRELDLSLDSTVMWTDSTITLSYIRNTTTRFKTFVANRLSIIHDHSDPKEWRYVPTKQNPADLASRGFKASDTESRDLWLHGPQFLRESPIDWPAEPTGTSYQEIENSAIVAETSAQELPVSDVLLTFTTRYSSLTKAVSALAWWRRYLKVLKDRKTSGPMTVNELEEARRLLTIAAQKRHYSIKSKEILPLGPVERDGIICVGQRVATVNGKWLELLPPKDPWTSLVVRHAHEENGHVGPAQVLASLRQTYWIVKGRSAVDRELRECRRCRRQKRGLQEQQMGSVLKEQVAPVSPPFSNVGVDLFGPLSVKQRRSTVKRYGVIFTCIATRAVHFEIAHSLTTGSFLAALSRFCARRGTPETLYSDRGTNFVRADKDLKEAFENWETEDAVQCTLRRKGIKWQFNPASASHRGGLWERLIRSAKTIMKSILQEQLVNDETLLTVITEVERIMNDRPITYVSSNPNDQDPLTPAHLLLLRQSVGLPPMNETSYVARWWRQANYLKDLFWKRWLAEYVPTLIKRQKWHKPRRNMEVGDVVLVADVNTPRGSWPLGRIEEVIPGRDGLVRRVVVKTAKSLLHRPISQLCLLEAASP